MPAQQAYLREHRPPTLIVWGPHDGYMPEASARAYHRDHPDAELHLLDVGHWLLEATSERSFPCSARSWTACTSDLPPERFVDAQVGCGNAPGSVASGPVCQRDDVASPPGGRHRAAKGVRAFGNSGAAVLGAPAAGGSREDLLAGGVVEPQVAKCRVRQRHGLQEAAFGGLDLQILLRQARAGKGDRADGADERVDGELVQVSCD